MSTECGSMVSITRDEIVQQLGHVPYDRFLLYLMGPYKSFNLNYVLTPEEREEIAIKDLPEPLKQLFQNEEAISEAKALPGRFRAVYELIPE